MDRRERRARRVEVHGDDFTRRSTTWAYTVVGGRVGRRSEAILLIKRWGIDPNKLTIKPDESPRDRASTTFYVSTNVSVYVRDYQCIRASTVFVYVPVCVYVRVYVCMSTTLFRPTLFFPSTVALDEPWEQRRTEEGWCRPRGGENKLISLTQPAVTPPQHDINPKPRLSLFKLYESLCRRIGATSGWLLLLPLASS